jgi:hypothetical protein
VKLLHNTALGTTLLCTDWVDLDWCNGALQFLRGYLLQWRRQFVLCY